LFSQDYRALARLTASPPPIALFGRNWATSALATWLVPAGLLAAGGLLGWGAARRFRALSPARATDDEKDASSPESTPVLGLSEQVRA
jgi:branched-chain amino acid transport system permease protein